MKSYEKEVLEAHLKSEQKTLKALKATYKQSLDDINAKIAELMGRSDADMQHVIYQVEYQKALKKQVEGILNTMEAEQFKTISDYLTKSYEDGFVGVMYSLQKQGIPLCFPINQKAVAKAVTLDSKISKGLYSRLGEDVTKLKKKIAAEVSRGISAGASYQQVAQNLATISNVGYNNAVRIAATEGHRIQVQSAMDACKKSKESGADIVKQWDSTLDGKTRPSHRKVDGEIRELDEVFSNGLMFPGDPKGGASEVVRCRCALLQRARWALDEDELEELKERAAFFGLDKSKNFEEFKKKYLNSMEEYAKMEAEEFTPAKTIKEAEDFARETLGVECSYKGVDLRCANEMNAAFMRGVRYCPKIKKQMNFVGSGQERNKRFKKDLAAYYVDELKVRYPGYSDSWYEKYAKQIASRSVGKIESRVFAFASRASDTDPNAVKRYTGIVVNNVFGGNVDLFEERLKASVSSGFHPLGCDTIASVFDHEMAHQIDYAVDLRNNAEMLALWKTLTKKEVEEGLSRYGATRIAEFIAEGYAEYVNNPEPREIACKIGTIIEKAVKES